MIENLSPEMIKELIKPENFSKNKESYIKDFKKNNIKGDFENYENNSLEDILKGDEDKIITIFSSAVSLAYDDAKRRFSGIGKVWKDDNKSKFFKYIANEIYNIFKNPENNFREQHNQICINLNNELKKLGYDDISYGKAQKIINMTFKYLYCLKNTEKYEKIFQNCHMPLDSFTLEWCRRYLNEQPDGLKSNTSWSGMESDLYISLQENIFNEITYPLYAEFIIWPEIQKHIAAEEFIFSFNSYIQESKLDKQKLKAKNLSDKFDIIRKILPAKNL